MSTKKSSGSTNQNLNRAAKAKKDEFYTQLSDIENELRHYTAHFKGKTVLCNCDDPYESNFFKFFTLNFNRLGLKKLIATCYSGSPLTGTQFSLFEDEPEAARTPYKAVVTTVHDTTGDGGVDMLDVAELFRNGENKLEKLQSNGDFRSEECIELLKEADIVVTNPPFSLFAEYIGTLVKYEKKFLVIGNQNAITYRDVFPLFQNNQLWLGYGFKRNCAHFLSPYEDKASDLDHKKGMIRVSGVMWYTNMDIKKRHELYPLFKRYSPAEYSRYDNYDAIEVSKSSEIPYDYEGAMGVPITFMPKHNPDQFEILGVTESEGKGFSNGLWDASSGVAQPVVAGSKVYKRIFIRNKLVDAK